MRKVKLGIIGTGLAAKNLHLPALQKLKNKFEIVAVCNHTEKKAKQFSKMVGDVPYHLDYKELLKRDDVEAVDIALPINLNYNVAKESIKACKHVFLEKPLAGNMHQAKQLLDMDKKSKTVNMVAENFRYRKVFLKVKDLIEKGKIGRPYAVNWNLYYHVTTDKDYWSTKWRQKHVHPSGFLLDAGVHNVAAIRMILGDFKSGNALIKSVNPKIGTFDTTAFQFELKNGIVGLYNLYFSVNGHWEDKLLIFGDKGSIEINTNVLTIKREGKKDKIEDLTDGHGYDAEFNDFYVAIVKGTKVDYSFKEAYRDMEIVLGALNSAENKKKVNF
ncbi:MAG: gfo/Idh/MocA family oxidoreductase [Ignavibacteriales bacterium]|jgi:predicted dehydrogenase|nr:MAG: gfo/Idh/MocA family oxidoreductase [Ignavibacteriales bacterium]